MVLNPPGREAGTDDPPYSRLFVVYNRKDPVTEQEIREDFGEFGEIQDVFVVKDKSNGEPKGIAYVKFSKMSEAANAMEGLNHKQIRNKVGIYKVYIAKNKGEGRGADEDPDRYLRLFIMVPKTATESDIKLHFSKFGDVQSVKLLRNRETNESKGIGYVTYSKVSEAAIAVEEGENEEGFKAVIARPKEKNPYPPHDSQNHGLSSHLSSRGKFPDLQSTFDFFTAHVSAKLNKDNIYRLFDIAPGLRDIEIVSQNLYRSEVIATYNSTLSAEYALNKLHGLEYPLGEFISVESKVVNKRPIPPSGNSYKSKESTNLYSGNSYSGSMGAGSSGGSGKRDYRGDYRTDQVDYGEDSPPHSESNKEVNQKLTALSKALIDATALLKSAGLSTESLGLKSSSSSETRATHSPYCDFAVPPTQPVLSKTDFDEQSGMRLFFVGHPAAPSMEALYDIYCRFGNFAGATVMARKNYGYLYFTSAESAHKAIKATDDKMIAGVSIKVLKADPKKGEPTQKRKRVRTEM